MSTIKDVAKAAGVSISTVSHVINGTRFVSEALHAQVHDAMALLDYQPNALARGLRRGGQTKTIGLVIPDNSNPFFAEIARSIEGHAFANGYGVLLCNSDDDEQKETTYINALIAKQVDGIIFIAAGAGHAQLKRLTKMNVPVVIVDRETSHAQIDTVILENEKGGYAATDYLIKLGHRRIACITGPSQLTPSANRVDGFRRALTAAGLTILPEYIVAGDFKRRGGELALHKLLQLAEPPTAVFACNDMMAIGALKTAAQRQIAVPAELSIIGFDNIAFAEAVSPALTTVAQPVAKLAQISVDRILLRMSAAANANLAAQRIVLEPTIVLRDSCAPLTKGE